MSLIERVSHGKIASGNYLAIVSRSLLAFGSRESNACRAYRLTINVSWTRKEAPPGRGRPMIESL